MLQNSLAWGGFLAVSSNTRYQIVAGIEERILVRPCPVHRPGALTRRALLMAALNMLLLCCRT